MVSFRGKSHKFWYHFFVCVTYSSWFFLYLEIKKFRWSQWEIINKCFKQRGTSVWKERRSNHWDNKSWIRKIRQVSGLQILWFGVWEDASNSFTCVIWGLEEQTNNKLGLTYSCKNLQSFFWGVGVGRTAYILLIKYNIAVLNASLIYYSV